MIGMLPHGKEGIGTKLLRVGEGSGALKHCGNDRTNVGLIMCAQLCQSIGVLLLQAAEQFRVAHTITAFHE